MCFSNLKIQASPTNSHAAAHALGTQHGSREHDAALVRARTLAHAHALALEDEALAQQPLLLASANGVEAFASKLRRRRLLPGCKAVLVDAIAAAVRIGPLRLDRCVLAMSRATRLLAVRPISRLRSSLR